MPEISAQYGHIPGYPPGSVFDKRTTCCKAGVHGQSQAGIHARKGQAFSICLSGGFEDDDDHGSYLYYTGCGDQTWANPRNKALRTSCQNRQPLRVVRGSRCTSQYAPPGSLYRYDGLYMITRAEREEGRDGAMKCRFLLQRLIDQDCHPDDFSDTELAPIDDEPWAPPIDIIPAQFPLTLNTPSNDPVMRRRRARRPELNANLTPPRRHSPY